MMTRPVSRARWLAVAVAAAAIPFLAPLAVHVGGDRDDEQGPAGRIAAILSCVLPASRVIQLVVGREPGSAPQPPLPTGAAGATGGTGPLVADPRELSGDRPRCASSGLISGRPRPGRRSS